MWAVLSFDFSENVVTVYCFEQMINKKKSRLVYEKEENSINNTCFCIIDLFFLFLA